MSILLADIDATCAALGYSDGKKYHIEPDALQGLKHLIWILRRDLSNHEYRRHLGQSQVLQTDLVHMLPDYVNDEEFADVLIRLMVILTNPTLLLYRDGPPKDRNGRKVFMELIDILQGYKSAFSSASVWMPLFGKLQKTLEIDWALRSEEQSLLIERILVLIRNVLQVPANPELECRADNDASVHDQVIWALHQSGILDLVLFVSSSPDEHQFHLHGLEILCLLYREQTAESLADASLQRSANEKQLDEQELLAARQRERDRLLARLPTSRHSRFGGTFVIRNMKSVSDRDLICHQPLERAVALDFDREKQLQKKSFRHIKEESLGTRRSAFSVRLCLREFCIEVLRSAYNTLVRQVRRVLERSSGSSSHDDSYLLWAIRFFMEFNRLSGLQLHLVSESLSVQCFHWVLTRMQHDMDMIVSDKKQARLWAKRLHVALQTFRELLQSLMALQKLQDPKAQALFDMLLNNVCYVLEYRETILHLMMNYNEAHSTKAYLRDVVETANIFLKMMEKFCKDSVVVQDKKRVKHRSSKKSNKPGKAVPETEEQLANRWSEITEHLTNFLSGEMQLAEDQQPLPFDAALEKSIDDQKEDCMIRIHKFLRESKLEQAIYLLRAAREVWPENDVFGSFTAAPEDELLLLREIFLHNIATVEEQTNDEENDENYENEENEEQEDNSMIEKVFKFDDIAKRLLNPKTVRACTVVLSDWEQIPTRSLKAAVTILYRIAYGCSCPAMLYQAKLFRIFQQVLNAPRDVHQDELRRLGAFVVRKFVQTAPNNPKIYAELLFYKSLKEANDLESGYCDDYEAGTKGAWSEEQETELRCLFEENQRNPTTEMDVIDWLLENLIDKTRTRRGILKKLKELGLTFKAPTKKSSAAALKHLWRSEEDEELHSLYDQYRAEPDCLQRMVDEFAERRSKQQIIKRLLQLHIIADKTEILPPKKLSKQRKRQRGQTDENDSEHAMEGQREGVEAVARKKRAKKPAKRHRKIVRTPLDIGTVRALIEQVDATKYQLAIDWLRECIADAAGDVDDDNRMVRAAAEGDGDGDDDDSVPLLPLQAVQKEAMEDAAFMKMLIALGLQPPIVGMESYWRIPTYLNTADLQLRAKILAGEIIEIDAQSIAEASEDDDERSGADGTSEDRDKDEDNEDKDEDDDDYLAQQHKKLDSLDDYMEQRRVQMQNLVYSRSDNEDEPRTGPQKTRTTAPKGKRKKSRNKVMNESKQEEEEAKAITTSTEIDVDVEVIKRKLDRKQKKRKQGKDSTDDDYEDSKATKAETNLEQRRNKIADTISFPNSDDLFGQHKRKQHRKKTAKKPQEGKAQAITDSDVDVEEIKRKLDKKKEKRKQGKDSTDDAEESEASEVTKAGRKQRRNKTKDIIDSSNSDVLFEQLKAERSSKVTLPNKNATLVGMKSVEEDDFNLNTEHFRKRLLELGDSDHSPNGHEHDDIDYNNINNSTENRSRRTNLIDSDSDTDNAATIAASTTATSKNKKRRLSEVDGVDVVAHEAEGSYGEKSEEGQDGEDEFFIKRHKSLKEQQIRAATGEEPPKRRRIAIIDDDDDSY